MNTEDEEYEEYDFEEWEGDATLVDEEDWPGLVKLRKARAEKRPDDLYALQGYGEALVLNEKYKEAIEFLSPLYHKYYDLGFGVYEILDALYGLGKSEKDFEWIIQPKILKLDQNTLDLCVSYLKGKRKHRSVVEISGELIMLADYCAFDDDELSTFLMGHPSIFDIKGDKDFFFDVELKLKKK